MGKRLLLIVSFCVVGFLLVFFLVSSIPQESQDKEEVEEEMEEVAPSPPVVMKGTELRGWEGGKLAWLLQAQDMELNDDNTKAICWGR